MMSDFSLAQISATQPVFPGIKILWNAISTVIHTWCRHRRIWFSDILREPANNVTDMSNNNKPTTEMARTKQTEQKTTKWRSSKRASSWATEGASKGTVKGKRLRESTKKLSLPQVQTSIKCMYCATCWNGSNVMVQAGWSTTVRAVQTTRFWWLLMANWRMLVQWSSSQSNKVSVACSDRGWGKIGAKFCQSLKIAATDSCARVCVCTTTQGLKWPKVNAATALTFREGRRYRLWSWHVLNRHYDWLDGTVCNLCMLWDETQGQRGSNEIGCLLYLYTVSQKKHATLFIWA